MFKAGRLAPVLWPIVGAYALLALTAIVLAPLRLSELLTLTATTPQMRGSVGDWILGTPGASPLFYFTQWVFVRTLGHPEISGRLPSLLSSLACIGVLWRLANRLPLQQPHLALLLFVLLPVQFRFATVGLPAEEAMLFLLLATTQLFELIDTPSVKSAALYAGFLTLCFYTDPFSFLPATGYLLSLLAFTHRKEQRRSIWFALPATALPTLLFVPYYLWAHPQTARTWLYGAERFPFSPTIAIDFWRELTASGVAGYVLSALLLVGTFIAAWRVLILPVNVMLKRVKLFCLFGGVVSTLALAAIIDGTSNTPFWAGHIYWATPSMAILATAALDWLAFTKRMKVIAGALAALLVITCIAGNIESFMEPVQDLKPAVKVARQQLTGDSCIVFVSEGLSGYLFVVFDPAFMKLECLNFYHHRVVLASHPWVLPEQQRDAESYFRGLNFYEVKRLSPQGSQVVVMEQR